MITMSDRVGIKVGKGFASFREMEFTQRWKESREQYQKTVQEQHKYGLICPLCNKEFLLGEIVYLIITNGLMEFPNIVIHKSCSHSDLQITCSKLMSSYEDYQIAIERHRAWL